MKKRIMAWLVSTMMLLGCCPGFAQEEGESVDVGESEFIQDIDLLINLGVTQGYDSIFNVYENVTRAQFACLIDGMLENKTYMGGQAFTDVPQEDPAAASINRLYAMGYVGGDGSGNFYPQNDIKYDEAVKILLSIAGYDQRARQEGGYPQGYLKVAAEAGLLKQVQSNEGFLTNGMACRMVVNSFDLNLMVAEQMGNNPTYVVDQSKTVLSDLIGIRWIKGRIMANADLNITGGPVTAEGMIQFNNSLFNTYDYDDYVGYTGVCYYRESAYGSGDFDVVYIKLDDNRSVKVQPKDFAGSGTYSYSYYEQSGRQKTLKTNKDTVYIYNGKFAAHFDEGMLKIDHGDLVFTDTDKDNIYDIVRINSYYSMVVSAVTQDKISDQYNPSKDLILEDYEKVTAVDAVGKRIDLSYINPGNVLSVYESQENGGEKDLRLVLSTQTVTGSVSGKTTRDGIVYVTVGEVSYPVYSGYYSKNGSTLENGMSGAFRLDAAQEIVAMDDMANDQYSPAYFIMTIYREDEEELSIKLYDSQGLHIAKVASRFVMDGARMDAGDYTQAASRLSNQQNEVMMVKYNKAGEITGMDTPFSGTTSYSMDDRLKRGTERNNVRFKAETMVFEGKCAIDDVTAVLVVPAEPKSAEETEFAISNSKYFLNDTGYSFTEYYLDEEKISADIVVIQGSTTNVGSDSSVGIVTEVSQAQTPEGDTGEQYTVNVFGTEAVWITKDMETARNIYKITAGTSGGSDTLAPLGTEHAIQKGDIIKCAFDEKGTVNKVALILDGSTKTMASLNPYMGDFHPLSYRYAYGTVTKKFKNWVLIALEDGTVECHNIGIKPVMEADQEQRELMRSSSADEVRVGDQLFIVNRGGNTVSTIIYR